MRTEPIVQAERDAFLRTQIDAVYGLNLPLIVMDALGCVLIASFCWSAATAPVLGLWLSINAVAMVVRAAVAFAYRLGRLPAIGTRGWAAALIAGAAFDGLMRSEEHTSELQSLMSISYAVFCLKKNTQ